VVTVIVGVGFGKVMVLNTTFNKISVKLFRGDQFYWWRKMEYPTPHKKKPRKPPSRKSLTNFITKPPSRKSLTNFIT
jgi:hypothetical protein